MPDKTPPPFFSRKNRLNDLLSSLQTNGRRFEEDEGFLYKRKTSPIHRLEAQIDLLEPKQKRKKGDVNESKTTKSKSSRKNESRNKHVESDLRDDQINLDTPLQKSTNPTTHRKNIDTKVTRTIDSNKAKTNQPSQLSKQSLSSNQPNLNSSSNQQNLNSSNPSSNSNSDQPPVKRKRGRPPKIRTEEELAELAEKERRRMIRREKRQKRQAEKEGKSGKNNIDGKKILDEKNIDGKKILDANKNILDENQLDNDLNILDVDQDSQAHQKTYQNTTLFSLVPPRSPSPSLLTVSSPVNRGQRRRSSYYSRGKRVSSITGFAGEPHPAVTPGNYYKLLDTGLPEPDRMRQLLVWCVKRTMDTETRRPGDDPTVHNIAHVIKEELLGDLMAKRVAVSWYGGEAPSAGKEVVIPNPLNVQNARNIDVYRAKLAAIVREKNEWQAAHRRAVERVLGLVKVVEKKKKEKSEGNKRNLDEDNLDEMLDDDLDQRQSIDINLDIDENLRKFVPEAERHYPRLIDGALVGELEQNGQKVGERVAEVGPHVDRLFHLVYRLDQTAKVVGARDFDEQMLDRLGQLVGGKGQGTRGVLRALTRVSQE